MLSLACIRQWILFFRIARYMNWRSTYSHTRRLSCWVALWTCVCRRLCLWCFTSLPRALVRGGVASSLQALLLSSDRRAPQHHDACVKKLRRRFIHSHRSCEGRNEEPYRVRSPEAKPHSLHVNRERIFLTVQTINFKATYVSMNMNVMLSAQVTVFNMLVPVVPLTRRLTWWRRQPH